MTFLRLLSAIIIIVLLSSSISCSTFSTLPDTIAPVISSVASSDITTTSATISWTTNELATSNMVYGLTTSYGSSFPSPADTTADNTSHSVVISGLLPNSTYHYKVKSKDAALNEAVSADFTFTTATTADTAAPVISSVATSGITSTAATITWTTNELATSNLVYGFTTSYGSSSTADTTVDNTSHSLVLSGLSPNTTYHYRVSSADASGNLATSIDSTFSTLADTTEPVVIPIVKGTNLLVNPGFESGTSGQPEGWTTAGWHAGKFTWDNTVAHSGQYSVKIEATDANDLRWVQTVKVLPNSKFKFTAWVKTLNVGHSLESYDIGANLALEGSYTVSQDLKGTNDWTMISLDIVTGASESTLTVELRLGYSWGTNTGTAWFDDASLELVDEGYVVAFEGKHIIVELFQEDVNKIQDIPSWLGKLDTAYELLAQLVGSTPYNGEKITIKEVLPMIFGGLAGNPILINSQGFIKSDEPNDLNFGVLHELGHDFDIQPASGFYIGDGAINAEGWANFKVLYMADQMASLFPEATTAPGYGGSILLGELGSKYFVDNNSEPYILAGSRDGLKMSHDVLTGLLYSLTRQIGWEPFKATFRDYQANSAEYVGVSSPVEKVRLFVNLLSKESGVDLAPAFRSWGFDIP